ncbi:signal peptidase I [Haloglomus irregulare]|mgnify:FL=1|jgi:signal peptidase|uniref:Signal peptidase I n=1 Tax=Haloglomus irregulare TaxID=2234134 RepID=A0A554MUT6_9EURY|nr:signal peptidase I [Haloglomus irregulare]TSD08884.1 signal peptidase I [Haloglomus irregulare]
MTRFLRPSRPGPAQLLVTIVLIAAVSPFAVFAVPQVIGADEGFVVLSGSMEPTMSPGDVVMVDASGPAGIGDVITYSRPGDSVPTTHRVVGVVDGGYETKGDANENADADLIGPEAVIGRVVLTIPVVGRLILWANTPVGYVALVISPLVLLGVSELLAWARREPDGGKKSAASPGAGAEASDDSGDPDADGTADWEFPAADAETEPAPVETVSIAAVDLKLTLLAMGALLAYAGWNLYWELSLTAAPTPISVGAFTMGLLGLLFAGWVTLAAWWAARAARSEPGSDSDPESDPSFDPEPKPTPLADVPALTDGSGDAEGDDE